jgi:peptide/nickel transport system substrate-binding protein
VVNPTIDLTYNPSATGVVGGIPTDTLAAKIQSDLKDVGITVNLVGQPVAVTFPKMQAGHIAMMLWAAPADYPDPLGFISRVPPGIQAKWQNWVVGVDPTVDRLVTTALAAVTPADRAAAFQAVVKATNDVARTIYIMQIGRAMVSARAVHATINPYYYVDLGSVT